MALGLQAFAASRILKYGGFGLLLLMLPVVAMFSYAAMALVPILAVVKLMKVAENATDYSLNNTARSVLWLPVASSVIYKAKPAIDTLFTRLGDGLAALTVIIGMELLALPIGSFFVLNLFLVVVWLVVSVVVVREHGLLVESTDDEASIPLVLDDWLAIIDEAARESFNLEYPYSSLAALVASVIPSVYNTMISPELYWNSLTSTYLWNSLFLKMPKPIPFVSKKSARLLFDR